eukprot:c24515_g3_i1 orf=472-651(+)
MKGHTARVALFTTGCQEVCAYYDNIMKLLRRRRRIPSKVRLVAGNCRRAPPLQKKLMML